MGAPPNFDQKEFAELKRLLADYLAQIARATGAKRLELILECAEKLYDARVQRRIGLVKSWGDVYDLKAELRLYPSVIVMPLLAPAHLNDIEIEAVGVALAGRESAWQAEMHLPAEDTAAENSVTDASTERAVVKDPIAAQRRARVEDYIAEVLRVKNQHIFRSNIWRTAKYKESSAFERWQRNDPRSNKRDDEAISRILTEKPHLK